MFQKKQDGAVKILLRPQVVASGSPSGVDNTVAGYVGRLVQELECVRYRSQAQSSASWGLPANVPVGRIESL